MGIWIESHLPGKTFGDVCLRCGMFKSQHMPWPIYVEELEESEDD